ncbi:tetratricopeptide repeat protein [Marinicaulis aureus]|uniref:Tetratricopeptide repeat protein n=1 Tax=Hyphococcus aureus TaxID=2666033 RepID=A0ABW1KV94_9PROT
MSGNFMQLLQGAAAQFQRGAFEAALEASETALRQQPGHPEALHMKALCLGRLGRVDEALPIFDQAAAGHPQKHAILANKGNALRAAGRFKDAIAEYESAIAAHPGFITAWISLGLALRQAGEGARAEEVMRKTLSLAPGDVNALNNLGLLLEDQDRPEEAAAMFSAALEKQPSMHFARVNRGAALRKIGRIEEALADLRMAVTAAPNDAETQYQYANALRQSGVMGEADSAFRRALAITPLRSDIHRDFARMLWEEGVGARFLEPLDMVLAQYPNAELLSLKSELAYLAGLPDLAEEAASRALALDQAAPTPKRILGLVRRHHGDSAAAAEMFADALAAAPDDYETLHTLVETRLASGEFEEAVRLLDREPPPDHLQKHIALKANAMRLSGDPEYRLYYDYDRFTRKMFIEPPEGYADLAAFNAALVEAILPLHRTAAHPLEQTLYGGTQSVGRLWEEPHPLIQALKGQLLAAAARYVEDLPDDPAHPFLCRKSKDLTCQGAWSVVLASGGGHVDHIHPKGWISASYYVQVPDEVAHGEKAGFLRLGASGLGGVTLEAERWFRPEVGAVIFFPSYMWHGVEPFASVRPRITAPFDLAPR